MRFDAKPLVGLFGGSIAACAAFYGVEARSVHRWVEFGLSAKQADHLAVRAGVHPGSLWEDWWRVADLAWEWEPLS